MKRKDRFGPVWHLAFLLCAVPGCSDSSSGGDFSPPTVGWITIEYQDDLVGAVSLGGEAFISPTWWRCCTGSATDTGVEVEWTNLTTGERGDAHQWAHYETTPFGTFLTGHTWSATIPLDPGENSIMVEASDPSGNIGSATTTAVPLPDTTPPLVISTVPTDGTTGFSVNSSITATFNEDVDTASVGTSTFSLSAGGPIVGTVTYSSDTRTATFTPLLDLEYQTSHTASVSGVRDLAGNTMTSAHSWSLETDVAPDTTPPMVVLTEPGADAGCVSSSMTITVVFSEPIDQTTVHTGSFVVLDGASSPVQGSTYTSSESAYFNPSSHLAFASNYSVTLTTEIADLAGNALQQEHSWTFWTGPEGTGQWGSMSVEGEPRYAYPTYDHVALWTGQEMLVWGGRHGGGAYLIDGGLYDPVTDSWRGMSRASFVLDPAPHAAVWTGTEMIVMGSFLVGTPGGARYDPALDAWTPTSVVDAPSPRDSECAVWTGREMIVWGGISDNNILPNYLLNDGARYDPATDTWTPMTSLAAPVGRMLPLAVWTGTEMIVWGGWESAYRQPVNSGGRYDPVADAWSPIATVNAPADREPDGVTATWTGVEMIVVGGGMAHAYDPIHDTWTELSLECSPSRRSKHSAVWTGTELILWGGIVDNPVSNELVYLDTGAYYSPASDTWGPVSRYSAPWSRSGHGAVWTGTEMLVWGGTRSFRPGGRLTP